MYSDFLFPGIRINRSPYGTYNIICFLFFQVFQETTTICSILVIFVTVHSYILVGAFLSRMKICLLPGKSPGFLNADAKYPHCTGQWFCLRRRSLPWQYWSGSCASTFLCLHNQQTSDPSPECILPDLKES